MLATAALGLLFILSAAALVGALLMSRQRRLDMDRRVKLVSATSVSGMERADAWLQARTKRADEHLRSFFTFGSGATWGMTSGVTRILLMAFAAAAIAWAATALGLGLPNWLAALITLAAAYVLPRLLLRRQQISAE